MLFHTFNFYNFELNKKILPTDIDFNVPALHLTKMGHLQWPPFN